MKKALVISICKERLHELEFVKPVADILKSSDIHFDVCHYTSLCAVDELVKLDRLMQKNVPTIDHLLSGKPSEFFEASEVAQYVNGFSHLIICGTSLQDNEFAKNLGAFSWINNVQIPILGICGGFQLIGLLSGGELRKKTEIGFYSESFPQKFLGIEGSLEVFHLHNNHVSFGEDFDIFCQAGKVVQAVKYKHKEIYGVLFHPEVRQKEMISEFVKK